MLFCKINLRLKKILPAAMLAVLIFVYGFQSKCFASNNIRIQKNQHIKFRQILTLNDITGPPKKQTLVIQDAKNFYDAWVGDLNFVKLPENINFEKETMLLVASGPKPANWEINILSVSKIGNKLRVEVVESECTAQDVTYTADTKFPFKAITIKKDYRPVIFHTVQNKKCPSHVLEMLKNERLRKAY